MVSNNWTAIILGFEHFSLEISHKQYIQNLKLRTPTLLAAF
jgi:hypothetical protein